VALHVATHLHCSVRLDFFHLFTSYITNRIIFVIMLNSSPSSSNLLQATRQLPGGYVSNSPPVTSAMSVYSGAAPSGGYYETSGRRITGGQTLVGQERVQQTRQISSTVINEQF